MRLGNGSTTELARNRPHIVIAVAALTFSSLLSAPALAGQAELDRLTSYIGNWSGAATLEGGENPQPFRCRLVIAKGAQTKINYQGRCTLASMNLSIAGTIAFDDATQTYQAVMSSNAGFTGYAIGREHNNQITFNLAEKQTDPSGRLVRIGARIHLIGESVKVDYEVEFNNSGKVLTAAVPFSR
jgi:hypothetical protein